MILADSNLLIYATDRDAAFHRKARPWLEGAVSGTEIVGLAWTVLLAFVRVTTRAGLFQRPLEVETAFDLVDAWVPTRGRHRRAYAPSSPHAAGSGVAAGDRGQPHFGCSPCGACNRACRRALFDGQRFWAFSKAPLAESLGLSSELESSPGSRAHPTQDEPHRHAPTVNNSSGPQSSV